jgi:hypothetical protein
MMNGYRSNGLLQDEINGCGHTRLKMPPVRHSLFILFSAISKPTMAW